MTIGMQTDAMRRGLADVAAATEALDAAQAGATRRVEELLLGWRGEAADSYAAAYDAWAAAARRARADLEQLHAGLGSARAALSGVDTGTVGAVAHLEARLG